MAWPLALACRFGAFAALWLVVAGHEPGGWPFGAAVAGAAALASRTLMPPSALRWRMGALLRFMPWFLWRSLAGGLDVALRALDPRLRIAPTLASHRLRLPEEPPRVMLAGTISLLPGTLAAGAEGDRLRVHQLDRNARWGEPIEATERRVAGLFGLEPPPADRQRGGRHG